MKPFLLALSLAALSFPSLAAAQTSGETETKKPVEDCQVQPDENTGKAEGQPGSNESLTQTLNPCDGVLKPPATGDKGLAEPPPDAGETPVIRPGEVPQQPAKPD